MWLCVLDCFFKQGEWCYALADYQQAEEMQPDDPAVRLRLGVLHNTLGSLCFQDGSVIKSQSLKLNKQNAVWISYVILLFQSCTQVKQIYGIIIWVYLIYCILSPLKSKENFRCCICVCVCVTTGVSMRQQPCFLWPSATIPQPVGTMRIDPRPFERS